MTQTLAIFHDAYRSLNAKKMFWVVLAISLFVVVSFACIGINQRGLKVLVWQLDTKPLTSESIEPAVMYKWLFAEIGIGVWLAWIGTILALVSTAGIFPDLITSGSIDLLVSKPIGRLRLFFTQYLAGLLFVTLQVTVFSGASFLVIGLRGGAWEPSLLLAIPLLVCFFSYLFSMCALLGLLTRSTLAALLLTLLFWFFVYGLGAAENTMLMFLKAEKHGGMGMQAQMLDEQAKAKQQRLQRRDRAEPTTVASSESPSRLPSDSQADRDTEPAADGGNVTRAVGKSLLAALAAEPEPSGKEDGVPPSVSDLESDATREPAAPPGAPDVDDEKEESETLRVAHNIVYWVKTFLPKTTETVALLERTLIDLADLPEGALGQPQRQNRAAMEMVEAIRSRSVAWVVGTSLGFEAFVLACAALIFCRRDY